jgi:hypothetical protein
MAIRNLAYLREKDPRLYETITDLITQVSNVAQQTNSNPNGPPSAPPAINSIKVTGQNGFFHVAITDQNPSVSRGISYFVEHDSSPQFTNPQIIHIGTSRNVTLAMGDVTRYFRAYSSYQGSAPSAPAYHGSAANPLPVSGGGSNGGPAFLPSQGSGTGSQGQGLSGFGPIPSRPMQP